MFRSVHSLVLSLEKMGAAGLAAGRTMMIHVLFLSWGYPCQNKHMLSLPMLVRACMQ